ncbi:hypothetical protein BS78_04G301200 [Paspalum vaginatum]|nr:hypothetical protein BS78_04G301200 [Paspalum vaginatum]
MDMEFVVGIQQNVTGERGLREASPARATTGRGSITDEGDDGACEVSPPRESGLREEVLAWETTRSRKASPARETMRPREELEPWERRGLARRCRWGRRGRVRRRRRGRQRRHRRSHRRRRRRGRACEGDDMATRGGGAGEGDGAREELPARETEPLAREMDLDGLDLGANSEENQGRRLGIEVKRMRV